jgi:hypothetical protein
MISYDVLLLDRKKPEFLDPLIVDWVITEGDILKINKKEYLLLEISSYPINQEERKPLLIVMLNK